MKVEQNVSFFYFFIRCKQCHNEMSIGTDPIKGEYIGIFGKVYEKEKFNEFSQVQQRTLQTKRKTLEQIENEILQEIENESKDEPAENLDRCN